jgi:hypothetical protein
MRQYGVRDAKTHEDTSVRSTSYGEISGDR